MAKESARGADLDLRIHAVVDQFTNGAMAGKVRQFCQTEWGISGRQADNYIAKARKLIQEDCRRERQEYAAEQVAILYKILERSMKSGNFACALGASQQLAKLCRLTD